MMNSNQNFIETFTQVLKEFDKVLDKVPEGGLDWVESEGEWSIRQVIHHVAEDCNVYAFIIERALALPGSKVILGEFPGNNVWADSLGFGNRPIDTAIQLMHVHRKFLAELVAFFPDRWENTVRFADEEGQQLATRSVKAMMIMLTEHMQEHVQMIRKIFEVHQG